MSNEYITTSSRVFTESPKIQSDYNETSEILREFINRSFEESRALTENKIAESLPVLLEKYYRNRLKEDFPSNNWGWDITTRKRVCPQMPFAFILGSPNSGTTLLFRILLEHPAIWGIFNESRLFVSGRTDKDILSTLFGWEYQARQGGKSLVLEKTPSHIERWTRIHNLVPNHKFLFLLRDGRDNVASSVASYKATHERMTQVWINALLEYETMRGAFKDDVLLVHLKNLQQKPEQTMTAVLKFLGLQCPDEILTHILSYHERPRRFEGSSSDVPSEKPEKITDMAAHRKLRCYQVNQPIQSDTSRWQTEFPYNKFPELHEKMTPWLLKYGYIEAKYGSAVDEAIINNPTGGLGDADPVAKVFQIYRSL